MAQCEAGTKAGNRNQGHEAGQAGEQCGDGQSIRREVMEQGPLWEQVLCVTETLKAAVISCSFCQKIFSALVWTMHSPEGAHFSRRCPCHLSEVHFGYYKEMVLLFQEFHCSLFHDEWGAQVMAPAARIPSQLSDFIVLIFCYLWKKESIKNGFLLLQGKE